MIGQASRGSIDASKLDAVQRIWPQVPVLIVLGSWCEGEARSDNPSPASNESCGINGKAISTVAAMAVSLPDTQRDRNESREFASDQTTPPPRSSTNVFDFCFDNRTATSTCGCVRALMRPNLKWCKMHWNCWALTAVWAEKSIWQAEELEAIVRSLLGLRILDRKLDESLDLHAQTISRQPVFC